MDEADQRVRVVPILGPVSIGKTTLAQLVYQNDRIRHTFSTIYFKWLGGTHDMLHFLNDIYLETFGIRDERDDERTTQQMKKEIKEFLSNERSLIVLDDLEDNTSHMTAARELIDMLSNKGSVILLTTRSRRAASFIGTTPTYQLQPLPPDHSYKLFAMYSLSDRSLEEHPIRDHLARKFVSLCCGVPLLLRAIGSYLYDKTVQEWEAYLCNVHNDGCPYDRNLESSFQTYEVSSHLRLPLHCFRLQEACGLSVEALSCVWMALGCLYDKTQSPESMARKILIEFANSHLCPDVQYAPGGVVQHINFNDALYRVATRSELWVTAREGRYFDGSPMYIIWDQDCVRGTVLASKYIDTPRTKKVRLFMVKPGRLAPVHLVQDISSCLGHLRVLGLNGCDIELLPDSIGKLKHLRYLDVGRNPRIKSLPNSICDLRLLQTLFLHGCFQLKELPAKIGRLQDLRYLTLTILKESFPEAVRQLTSLWTLGLTSCLSLASLPTVKNLRTLAVVNCPKLDLAASSSVAVFKGLDAIQTLLLSHLPEFAGLPSDLGNVSVTLKHLHILSCTKLTEIKWIIQFKFLRSLTIEECSELTDLKLTDGASELKYLLELVIRRCPGFGDTTWIKQFVSLRSLTIDGSPNLVELDVGFSDLKRRERLEIKSCGVSTEWFASTAGKKWRSDAHVQVIEVDGAPLES